MDVKRCDNCSAPMTLNAAKDKYTCPYCGSTAVIHPKTAIEHVSSFINRAVAFFSEEEEPDQPLTPEQAAYQQKMKELQEKREKAARLYREKQMNKNIKREEKRIAKLSRK